MSDTLATHEHYIVATNPRTPELNHVLKHDDAFALFEAGGDIGPAGGAADGLYFHGTRFLSRLCLAINGQAPLLLSSRVADDNDRFSADLTNPDLTRGTDVLLPRDVLHLLRSRFVWHGTMYERLQVWSYEPEEVQVTVSYLCAADFADIFEVRGSKRPKRGRTLPVRRRPDGLVFSYDGLDAICRETDVTFDPVPRVLEDDLAEFRLTLRMGEPSTITTRVSCTFRGEDLSRVLTPVRVVGAVSGVTPVGASYAEAAKAVSAEMDTFKTASCVFEASNEQCNAWIRRSASDIRMMLTSAETGPYPYAGVPWFSTAFGRDGIITALELLPVDPSIARGVLGYLAALQADAIDPAADAEPGKILHEVRGGEMAALGEVPFRRYYGSIDSTPLFVMLAGAYYRRTADRAFVDTLWPHVERALEWIDRFGDLDGDGFVEYARRSDHGLVQQGWKDSSDSVYHRDGRLAPAPIALCEVQGYVYAAKRAAAGLAAARGDNARATQLRAQADQLRVKFDQAFWLDDLGTYALAICGDKQPCRIRTSNAGQCLYTGIVETRRVRQLAATLFDASSFSGWGIRTVASTEPRYNPMSYHNGSIWPHDNALIAAGLARYGHVEPALRVLEALFDASRSTRLHRLPELFCGFERRTGDGPTLYPVACAPQAWSAGAVFLLLQACLGLSIDAPRRRIEVRNGRLPRFLRHLTIRNLRVADATVDLRCERDQNGVGIRLLRREGQLDVLVRK